jgi:hypothetical protein
MKSGAYNRAIDCTVTTPVFHQSTC